MYILSHRNLLKAVFLYLLYKNAKKKCQRGSFWMGTKQLLLFVGIIACTLPHASRAQLEGMADLASALNKNVEAVDRLAPSMAALTQMGDKAFDKWDTSMKPSVDDALKMVNATLDRYDNTMSYVQGTLIPMVFGFGTLWIVLCSTSIVLCVVLPRFVLYPFL